jgi:hypothetical protein
VELKLIKEVHINDFQYAAYGFGFQVSKTLPLRLEGLMAAVVISSDEVRGYSHNELEEAIKVWGEQKYTSVTRILEYPESKVLPESKGI